MKPITLFSWGYWGWGNATRQLVEMVDAVEVGRGFAPPRFVDVRISRAVRAAGFRDGAFEKLLGSSRYRWLKGLGNRSVLSGRGPRVVIDDPGQAAELLALAERSVTENRRIIFFCSCERPSDEALGSCHRVTVAGLLREAAAKHGVALETVEWPGGTPAMLQIETTPSNLRAVTKGRATLPLSDSPPLGQLGAVPWGSAVRITAADSQVTIISGPARYQAGGWVMPIVKVLAPEGASRAELLREARQFRGDHGYDSTQSTPSRVAQRSSTPMASLKALHSSSVYTIAHIEKLEAASEGAGSTTFAEARPWVTAAEILKAAMQADALLPIIFADAADCSRLLYWAVLTAITTAAGGTRYTFAGLRKIAGRHTPQDLILLSTGRHIAPNFIRPYALCRTPDFLERQHDRVPER